MQGCGGGRGATPASEGGGGGATSRCHRDPEQQAGGDAAGGKERDVVSDPCSPARGVSPNTPPLLPTPPSPTVQLGN